MSPKISCFAVGLKFSPKDCPIQQEPLHIPSKVHSNLGTSLVAPCAHSGFETNISQSWSWGPHFAVKFGLCPKIVRSKGNGSDVCTFSNTPEEPCPVSLDPCTLWPDLRTFYKRKLAKDCPIQRQRLHILSDIQQHVTTSWAAPRACEGFEANITRNSSRGSYWPEHMSRAGWASIVLSHGCLTIAIWLRLITS